MLKRAQMRPLFLFELKLTRQSGMSQSSGFELAKRHFLAGVEAMERSDFETSAQEFQRSLAYLPGRPSTLINLQAVLVKLGRFDAALSMKPDILRIDPNAAEVYINCGNAYRARHEWTYAYDEYSSAILLDSSKEEAWSNRGAVNVEMQQPEAAEADFIRALSLNKNNPDVLNNLGALYNSLRRFDDAYRVLMKSIELKPKNPEAENNLGNLYLDLHKYSEAAYCFEKSLRLNPQNAGVHFNLGDALTALKKFEIALRSYEKAIGLDPTIKWLKGRRLLTAAKICHWPGFAVDRLAIINDIESEMPVITPFDALCLYSNPAILKRCAEIYVQRTCVANRVTIPAYLHKKIRVGYLSCDFREHAVSYLILGLLESHDIERFDILGFDIGTNDRSPVRDRVVASFKNFYELSHLSDIEIAKKIRDCEVDILVDLTGYTRGARTKVLAHGAAPIQVNYLGFPGTMGANEFIDYIIADDVLIPSGFDKYYSEKVVYLPNCFQPNDSNRLIGLPKDRTSYGLSKNSFVFASFTQAAKINEETFTIWLQIIRRTKDSVLWLIRESDTQEKNLKEYAARHGVLADRLIFSGVLPYSDHLARYRLVDLVLDTVPFNGGTTTSDALWAGAPVLTCSGDAFSSRMSASLLSALGAPELITSSLEEYSRVAVDLACRREKLSEIRQKINKNRETSNVFDSKSIANRLEAAYESMYKRYEQGLPPNHIRTIPIN